ncbi:hypothetical protein [Dokdonella soli]|uniref:Uncharacterized protein n=1 Tax=Dokdonella soli TaxID=529810 RepID=A0ABN1IKK9_9GAMM
MGFRLGAALAALLACGCLEPAAAGSRTATGRDGLQFSPAVDARGYIDVWRLRHDVAVVEARYADGSDHAEIEVCEREGGEADEPLDDRAQRRQQRAKQACIENVQRRYAAYQKLFAAFNNAWLPAIRNAIAKGDTVAEVILRQCATTKALDRSGIESTCDEEPRKSVAMKRLREIGFTAALDIEFPNWQQSPGQRKSQLDSQQRALEAIRHGALGFDTMEVSTDGNVARTADDLQSYRNYAVIEAALQDAPRAFTVTPGTYESWRTSAFSALRVNRQALTPGYLTWGRRLYFGGSPRIYTGPHYWRSSPTRVFVPRGDSMEEIAVSGADDAQFRHELAETLAATEASIDAWLKQDPRWGVFLLHRVGLHEWVPQGMQSTTQALNPAWAGRWRLAAQTQDWDKPMQPASGDAVIRRDGRGMTMSVTAAQAAEPFANVGACTLRYSGGLTYLPDETPNGDVHTALGYIDAAQARQALAPLDRRKRYKQVLMQCEDAESADSDRIRFLLLARDRMVEIGMEATGRRSHVSVRQYRRIR